MDRPVNDDFNRYQIQQNQMGIPVAISNEQPFAMEVIDPSSLETVKSRLLNFFKGLFRKKIVIFWKFSIFDSKFLENYITDFQTKTSFELHRARAFEWNLFGAYNEI